MTNKKVVLSDDIKRLKLLAEKYPNIQSASTEIINLQAISSLPKGTEHFVSDPHGEYETFQHIINNASGAIREKVSTIYKNSISSDERAKLSTLIYYPNEKLHEIIKEKTNTEEWYKITLNRLIEVCRLVASKYTRSKVRKALPPDFAYIIEELLHNHYKDPNKSYYYANIIDTIIEVERADAFIIALCDTIKHLVVDHLHVIGDIFDRGPRPDIIMDSLEKHHSIDIQWGNHDIIWMGAASGSRVCIAAVLNTSITYDNLEFLEQGYGINLRPLALFANEVYKDSDVTCFKPKMINHENETVNQKSIEISARMRKAVAIMQFKLEGQLIKRNKDFDMDHRLLLDKIDPSKKIVKIGIKEYPMKDVDFPTIDFKNDPYKLTNDEFELMQQLKSAFLHSEKLQRHINFLYRNGSIYKCYNNNLLLHGCIPLTKYGNVLNFKIGGKKRSGKDFMDYAETIVRTGYFSPDDSEEKQFGKDFFWFLWCGKYSPLFGKDKMATFERLLVDEPSTWVEEKNPYYKFSMDENVCVDLLRLFGINKKYSHIINGHVPVKYKDGEKPVRANGKLIIIDGGLCRAYQSTTGLAGYTLIYNSYGLRLCSHEPFEGTKNSIKNNTDILSTSVVSERVTKRITVGETDKGKEILATIEDLKLLLSSYRLGLIKENIK